MNVREGQYIVSKDRDRVLAKWRVDMNLQHGNSMRWQTIAQVSTAMRISEGDRSDMLTPIEHEVVVDYEVPGIVIWRYTGDAPHVAFDKPQWFEKL